jgi:hypothetical protein
MENLVLTAANYQESGTGDEVVIGRPQVRERVVK